MINQCSHRIWEYVDGWRLWRRPLTIATASQQQNEENHKTLTVLPICRDSSELLNLVTSQALHNRSQISYRHTQDIQTLVNVKGPTCFCCWELSVWKFCLMCKTGSWEYLTPMLWSWDTKSPTPSLESLMIKECLQHEHRRSCKAELLSKHRSCYSNKDLYYVIMNQRIYITTTVHLSYG